VEISSGNPSRMCRTGTRSPTVPERPPQSSVVRSPRSPVQPAFGDTAKVQRTKRHGRMRDASERLGASHRPSSDRCGESSRRPIALAEAYAGGIAADLSGAAIVGDRPLRRRRVTMSVISSRPVEMLYAAVDGGDSDGGDGELDACNGWRSATPTRCHLGRCCLTPKRHDYDCDISGSARSVGTHQHDSTAEHRQIPDPSPGGGRAGRPGSRTPCS
jgi:hypothetical protein